MGEPLLAAVSGWIAAHCVVEASPSGPLLALIRSQLDHCGLERLAATCPPCRPPPRDLMRLWSAAVVVAFCLGWADADATFFRRERSLRRHEPAAPWRSSTPRTERASPREVSERPGNGARRLLGRALGVARGQIVEA